MVAVMPLQLRYELRSCPKSEAGCGRISANGVADDTGLCFPPAHARTYPVSLQADESTDRQADMVPLGACCADLGPLDTAILLQSAVVLFDSP